MTVWDFWDPVSISARLPCDAASMVIPHYKRLTAEIGFVGSWRLPWRGQCYTVLF